MRRIILISLLTFFSISVSQNLKSKKGENILPVPGEWSISSTATPLFNFMNTVFTGDSKGVDFSFFDDVTIDLKKITDDNTAVRYSFILDYSSENQTWAMGLGYGVERRRGETRLQGLWGYQGSIEISEYSEYNMSISAGLFIGCEYFALPKISIGAEYVYGGAIDIQNDETTFHLGGQTTKIKINYYF